MVCAFYGSARNRRKLFVMQFQVFTDPRYHAERFVEVDLSQIVSVEEKSVKLFLGASHRVTQITLQSGETMLLRGEIARRIEAARKRLEK